MQLFNLQIFSVLDETQSDKQTKWINSKDPLHSQIETKGLSDKSLFWKQILQFLCSFEVQLSSIREFFLKSKLFWSFSPIFRKVTFNLIFPILIRDPIFRFTFFLYFFLQIQNCLRNILRLNTSIYCME